MMSFPVIRKNIFIVLCLLTVSVWAKAQTANQYPQDYFRNPLDIPIVLAGNFGECRANHFHSGLDIKTEQRENLKVHAAAEGYICRIKMQKGGFGHALYVRHPHGYTTLYAHLNDFKPDVQAYVKDAQYKNKSWRVDLFPDAGQFPVKKGDFIAWSGNTGGSTAPHLHFEIRDTRNEHPLNPALFGLKINDQIAPKPTDIILYDFQKSIYMQEPTFKDLSIKGGIYTTKEDTVVTNSATVGIALKTNDYMNGSNNTLTYHTAELYMDGKLQCKITLDDIGYDITRYMNAFVDYSQKKNGKGWVQCLFRLPGNKLTSIYELNDSRGGLNIEDKNPHKVEIILTDPFGNISRINTYIKYSGFSTATLPNCYQIFIAGETNTYTNTNVKFTMPASALYDNVCFEFSEKDDPNSYSARYKIHHSDVPVHSYFTLYLKPDKLIPFNLRDKIALIYNDGNGDEGENAVFDNGWYKASTRMLGEYRLVADTVAPVIKPMQANGANLSKSSSIIFRVKDELTTVDDFDAKLDGKWICFEQNGDLFYYKFDEHCPAGKHELVITAKDENNNIAKYNYTFTR